MPYEREGYAPWSLTREAGVQSATVAGTVKVPQYVQPTLSTGFVDEKGNWQGSKSSDEQFIGLTKALAVANTASVLFPDTNTFPSIDMTGFKSLFVAVKITASGNLAISAVMGPDTVPFANLSPVNTGGRLRGAGGGIRGPADRFDDLMVDGADSISANVWTIFYMKDNLADQKNMQFAVSNETGSTSDIEFGFMRLV